MRKSVILHWKFSISGGIKMNSKGKKVTDILLHTVLSVMLFLLLISISVFATLAFRPLYYLDIDYLNIQKEAEEWGVHLTKEEIRANYDALIDYNLPLTDGKLVFPDLEQSESGESHCAEVKNIFDIFKYIAIVLLPLCGAGIYYLHKVKKQKLYLLETGIVTVVLPVLVGSLIALNWEKVFLIFHKLVFNNNDWIYDPYTDPIITILPSEFFMHCAVMIIGLVLLGGGISIFLWFYLGKRKKGALDSRQTDTDLKEQ